MCITGMRMLVILLVFGAVAVTKTNPASAADFGGNCCADLEERIAELEATTARKGNRRVSLFIYGEVNQAVLHWDDGAENNTYVVTNATTKNLLGFEGQARISADWSAGYRLEVDLITALSDSVDQGQTDFINAFPGNNPNNPPILGSVNGFGDDGVVSGGSPLRIRHAHWWVQNKQLGKVTVGMASQATDGIAEVDLSGATSVALSSVDTWNENFFLRDDQNLTPALFQFFAAGQIAASYVEVFRGNLDGGRANIVRYDSPALAGFTVSASWGEDDDWDVALRYASKWGDFNVAAGIGYREGVTTDTDNFLVNFAGGIVEFDQHVVVGSASVLHEPTGLFGVFAAGKRDWQELIINGTTVADLNGIVLDDTYYYFKGGIFQRFNSLGKTSIYGEYYHIDGVGADTARFATTVSQAALDEDAHVWGVGIVQHIDAAAMEVYAAYRHYEADDITDLFFANAINADVTHDIEMDMIMSGARIKF